MWQGWHACGTYAREPGADDDLDIWVDRKIYKPERK
jgi:hypothetical protein